MPLAVLFSGLVGALAGLVVTAGFHFWKLRRDELNARCNELCDLILKCASASSAYWADDYAGKLKEMRIAEATIMGLQSLSEGLYAELKVHFDGDESERIDLLMSNLLDALTGGDFTVERRGADLMRTRAAPEAAAGVIVAIRTAHQNTIPFAAFARLIAENRRRTLDLPRNWK